MADNENPQFEAHPEQNKTLFIPRMVRIEKLDGILIVKHRARFFEGNTMFSYIGLFLPAVPHEPQLIHTYIVRIEERADQELRGENA